MLTSFKRHRQTPIAKHDQKTRHMGLAHATQLRIPLCYLKLGDFLEKRAIRCRVRDPFRHSRGYGGPAGILLGSPGSPVCRNRAFAQGDGGGSAFRKRAGCSFYQCNRGSGLGSGGAFGERALPGLPARWWAIAAPTDIKRTLSERDTSPFTTTLRYHISPPEINEK